MQKIFLGLGMLALGLGIFTSFTDMAVAYRGDPTVKGPNYSEERHTLMQKAFETNDYSTWKNLMQNRGRVTQVINENNFSKFSEAHKLALSGDLNGSQKIRQELGLGLKNGLGQGMNRANRGLNFNR